MRLEVTNFAKIKSADIKIDGITVIAGENNTGKSTIGKLLYAIFNSMYDIAGKIEESRKSEVRARCSDVIKNVLFQTERERQLDSRIIRPSRAAVAVSQKLSQKISDTDTSMLDETTLTSMLLDIAARYGVHMDQDVINEIVEETKASIELIDKMEDYTIAVELIEQFFNNVFTEQLTNLRNHEPARLHLTIQGKDVDLGFDKNKCIHWKTNIDILHEAFFVDDPFVLDELECSYFEQKITRSLLLDKIEDDNRNDSVVTFVLAKEKLKEIFDILNKVVPGGIEDKNGEWALSLDGYSEPVRFDNLSAGLKSFVLLKIMLEKGILKEKDVLILDEPEIHLHPEWQIKYAEIIVLLQKKFDLSIVVTTHSRDFFEAIELYAKKYQMIDKCSFYLSRQTDGEVEFDDVSEDISQIYKHLVTPSRLLDKLKFELEESADE